MCDSPKYHLKFADEEPLPVTLISGISSHISDMYDDHSSPLVSPDAKLAQFCFVLLL